MAESTPTIYVTGTTGYIGGRLAPRLVQRGYRVRCLTRSAAKLLSRPWANHEMVEIVEGDAGDQSTLIKTMRGCSCAYYLVHSMNPNVEKYREQDLQLARLLGTRLRPRVWSGSFISADSAVRKTISASIFSPGVRSKEHWLMEGSR